MNIVILKVKILRKLCFISTGNFERKIFSHINYTFIKIVLAINIKKKKKNTK